MDTSERLAALEARVARLEGGQAQQPAEAPDAGAFWALRGLKDRLPGSVLFTGAVELPTGEAYEWQQAHPAADLLDEDWSELAPALAALAHPVRLLLLREVLHGTRTTQELSGLDGLGTSGQLYHHLRQLVAAGWLRTTARGRYGVPGERVVPLLTILAAARR